MNAGKSTALLQSSHNYRERGMHTLVYTAELDRRYNANRFGSHLGAGVRFRIGSSRQAVFAEARRVIADEVNRTVVRIGGLLLMGDLYRPRTVRR